MHEVNLAQRPNRSKRRGRVRDNAAPPAAAPDRYQKYLPEWMRTTGGAPPPRPPRARRARAQRPVGGYTPGKFATPDPLS
jgi:hypothetical protein